MSRSRTYIIILAILLVTSMVIGASTTKPVPGVSIDQDTFASNIPGLIAGEAVVRLPDDDSYTKAVASGNYHGGRIINSYTPMRVLRLELPSELRRDEAGFREACSADGAEVSPNYIRKAHVIPNDPKLGLQAGYLTPIEAQAGWDIFTGDASIVVAVIDTGIEMDHPDLQVNIFGGANLRPDENPNDLSDPHGHGTAVAGIIGASTDNSTGVAGVCWRVGIIPIKVLGGEELTTTLFEEAAAIDYAVSVGARIINMSFGGPGTSSVEKSAISRAYNAGVILVASAGNDSVYGDFDLAPDGLNYPSAFPEVIGVGSLDKDLERSDFSNWGQDQCEFVTVGEGVYTTLPGGLGDIVGPIIEGRNYGWATGTSFAAPQVTGLAALLRMKEPNLDPDGVRKRLRDNAKYMGGPDNDGDGVDDILGYGLIQCRDSLIDSPVGRNSVFRAGAFASPVFNEKLYVYVEVLTVVDQGSLAITGIPENGPAVSFTIGRLDSGNYIGTTDWPPAFGPVEIEIIAMSGGNSVPKLVITYKP